MSADSMAAIDDEVERVLELQRRFVAETGEMLRRTAELGDSVKRLVRLNEEAESRPAKRRTRIRQMAEFWGVVARELGEHLWQLDMDKLFAYMLAVPLLGRALKQNRELWRRKLAFEYPEYWEQEVEPETGALRAATAAALLGRARHSQVEATRVEPGEVDAFYLLYQSARALDIHMDKLGLGLATQSEPLREAWREDLPDTLADYEQHTLQFEGWTPVEMGADVGYAYYNFARQRAVRLLARPDADVIFRAPVSGGLLLVYAKGDNAYTELRIDMWLYAAERWRSEQPLRITDARHCVPLAIRGDALLRMQIPAQPDGQPGGLRKWIDLPVDALFDMAAARGGELSLAELRSAFMRTSRRPDGRNRRQLRSGLWLYSRTSPDRRREEKIKLKHPAFPGLSVPVRLANDDQHHTFSVFRAARSNLAVSYERPLIYGRFDEDRAVSDGKTLRPADIHSARDYWFAPDASASLVTVYSQANLFRFGRTVFELELASDLDAEPVHIQKYANRLYVWASPLEIRVYDLFDLFARAQLDSEHPLVALKL